MWTANCIFRYNNYLVCSICHHSISNSKPLYLLKQLIPRHHIYGKQKEKHRLLEAVSDCMDVLRVTWY